MERTISWTGKRFYDLVTCPGARWAVPPFAQPWPEAQPPGFQASLTARIRTAPVIVADNIVEHMFMGTPQEEWEMREHFPNLAPPFERCWIEGRRPTGCRSLAGVASTSDMPRYTGVYLESLTGAEALVASNAAAEDGTTAAQVRRMLDFNVERLGRDGLEAMRAKCEAAAVRLGRKLTNADMVATLTPAEYALLTGVHALQALGEGKIPGIMESILADVRWHVQGIVFMSDGRDGVSGPCGIITYNVLGDGRIVSGCEGSSLLYPPRDGVALQEIVDVLWWTAKPLLLAICFMHAKNVSTPVVAPPAALAAKYARRHGQALTTYRVLVVEPVAGGERHATRPGAEQAARAMHLCRGHFKTFTADHPLFGKYSGTFWWASAVRGTSDAGVVVKRYAVRDGGD
jgi:hypothetical protein